MATSPASHTDPRLRSLDTLADWLDSRFTIPGTDIRFGLDAVVGLIPGAGNAAGYLASSALVLTMARHGASMRLVVRMLLNIALDATVGAIPILGSIFDVAFKANNRNVRLLREHYAEGKHTGSVWPVVLAALAGLLLVGALMVYVIYVVLAALWTWAS